MRSANLKKACLPLSSLARALGFSLCFQNFDRELEDLPRVAPYRSNPVECALSMELDLTEET